jgi:NAD(P)-dependent dehydrogenase (short-subunit alcohol dehydrogenase family)
VGTPSRSKTPRDQRDYPLCIRVAVVTGGSSGIGAALARRLTERGWRCVLLARGRERLEAVAAETGSEAEVCDVGDHAAVEAAARRVSERHEAVRLLVSNAGIPARGGFLDLPDDRIEELVRTNYLGGVWCLRAFLPLLERGAPSYVVNLVSIAGSVAVGSYGPYAAAKHAQAAFSRSVAAELAPRGIQVHTVNPGPVETESFPQRRLLSDRLGRRIVLQPDRVADAIIRALERGRRETFVPAGFRLVAAAAGIAPGTMTQLAIRRGPRR